VSQPFGCTALISPKLFQRILPTTPTCARGGRSCTIPHSSVSRALWLSLCLGLCATCACARCPAGCSWANLSIHLLKRIFHPPLFPRDPTHRNTRVGLLMFILCGLRARFLTRDAGFAIDGNQKAGAAFSSVCGLSHTTSRFQFLRTQKQRTATGVALPRNPRGSAALIILSVHSRNSSTYNFNITMPALSCEYASVDMLDLYDGSNKFVMTKDIAKVGCADSGLHLWSPRHLSYTCRLFGGRCEEI